MPSASMSASSCPPTGVEDAFTRCRPRPADLLVPQDPQTDDPDPASRRGSVSGVSRGLEGSVCGSRGPRWDPGASGAADAGDDLRLHGGAAGGCEPVY